MTCVYLTSDWHLGHENVAKWRTTIATPCIPWAEHDEFILESYREIVTKRDVVWFLGDIIMNKRYLDVVANLPGTKHIVLGNHDTKPDHLADGITVRNLIDVFDHVTGLVRYKDTWLSHAPIHPSELRGKPNIHGHMHVNEIDSPAYINVCVEHTGFKPVKFQDLRPRINRGKEFLHTE